MAGTIVRVTPKQKITFATSSGAVSEILLAREIDVTGSREAQLLVRIHDTTAVSGTALSVKVRAVGPTGDDPSRDFAASADLASQDIANALPAGTFYVANVTANFGSHLRVLLHATAVAGSVNVTLSIDLVHKS